MKQFHITSRPKIYAILITTNAKDLIIPSLFIVTVEFYS
jgi:hypothetical protein